MRKLLTVMLLGMLSANIASAQSTSLEELRGGGSWKTDGELKHAAQKWSLDLQRGEDGIVTGLITIRDSPLFSVGHVTGKLEDRIISGSITDEHGNHVAQFNGVLSPNGFRGKYIDRTGESGEWEWEGKLPE